jgi:dihydrofolate reductase
MRRVIYLAMVSLDGYIARPDGALDWVIIDEELHTYVNEQQREIGAYLYGRRMYELMAQDWPKAADDPTAPGYILEFARIWKQMPKIVFSKTLTHVEWNATLVRGDVADEIARLKAQPGEDLEVSGAGVAGTLMRHGLIDDYQLFVNPVVLGSGVRPFPASDEALKLRLIETRAFRSGVVYLRYQRTGST